MGPWKKNTKMTISCTLVLALVLLVLGARGEVAQNTAQSLECTPEGRPKAICLATDYSTFDLPIRTECNEIKIGFEISDVLKIDDKDYSITFGLYFSVEWIEPRLNLSQDLWGPSNVESDEDLVPVNLELINSLWVPNIFIYNLKTFRVIDVLSKLAGLWIDRRKRIYYSQATHITFICPMLFDSFPLDTQICKFQVGSYSYEMSRMKFGVSTLGYIQSSGSQSIILDYKISINELKLRDQIFDAGALGNFSLAGFEMTLERHVMSYIITYYLPSGLFVVVSWISFLIPPDIVPGRMSLLITLFLVLVNIFNNVTTNSPKAEGLTAIEIWMLACILFVFGALIEYAVILFKKQKEQKEPKKEAAVHRSSGSNGRLCRLESPQSDENMELVLPRINGCKDENNQEEASVLLSDEGGKQPAVSILCRSRGEEPVPCKKAAKGGFTTWNYKYAIVDRCFLFVSPVLFGCFNAAYWYHYLDLWRYLPPSFREYWGIREE